MASLVEQAQALQSVLGDLSTLSTKDLVGLYKKLESDGATAADLLDAFKAVFPEVVQPYVEAASEVANQWYGELAPDEPYTPKAVAAIDAVSQDRMMNSLEWAFRAAGTAHPLTRLTGSAQRMVFDGARATILRNADTEKVKYSRLASPGACEFCRVMATRGAVYRSAHAAQAGHDNCHCVPAVARGKLKFQRPGYYQDWDAEYIETVKQLEAEQIKPTLNAVLSKMRANELAASGSGPTLVAMSTKKSPAPADLAKWLDAEKQHQADVTTWLVAEKDFTKKKAKAAAQAKYVAKKKATAEWLAAEQQYQTDATAWLVAEKDFTKKKAKAAAQAKYVANKKAAANTVAWLKAEQVYNEQQTLLEMAAAAAKASAKVTAMANAAANVDLKKAAKALAAAKHAAKKKGDTAKYNALAKMTPAEYAQSKGGNASKATTTATAKVTTPETAPTAGVGTVSTATKPKVVVGELTDSPNVLASTGQVLGTHGATVYTDSQSQKWLVKGPKNPNDQFLVTLDAASAELQAKSGLTTPAMYIMTVGGKRQSVQYMFPGSKSAFPSGVDLSTISEADLLTIQKHHALDWLMGNHDSHAGQFIRTGGGEIVGIDKGQAFKYFSGDTLDWNYHPNVKHGTPEPIYNTLFRQYAEGKPGKLLNPSGDELASYIQGLQAIPDKEIRNLFRPYAEGAVKQGKLLAEANGNIATNNVDAFLDAVVARKNSLATDLSSYYIKAVEKRLTNTKVKGEVITVPPGLNITQGDFLPPSPIPTGPTPILDGDVLKKAGKALASAKYVAKKKGDTANFAQLSKMTPAQYWQMKNGNATPAVAQPVTNNPTKSAKILEWEQEFLKNAGSGGFFQPVKAYAVEKGIKLSEAIPEFDKEFGIAALTTDQLANLLGYYDVGVQTKWLGKYGDALGDDMAKKALDKLKAQGNSKIKEQPKPVVIKQGTKYTPEHEQPAGELTKLGKTVIADSKAPVGSADNPHVFDASGKAVEWQQFGSLMSPQNASAWKSNQHSAIKSYTGSGYSTMNAHAREDKVPSAKTKALDSAFYEHNPFEEHIVLSRGTHAVEFNDENSLGMKFSFGADIDALKVLEGETYVSKSFLSTSITTTPAFHNPVRVLYKMKPGQRGIFVSGTPDGMDQLTSVGTHEREVILPRNQKMKVLEVRKSTGSSQFKVDVIVEVVDQPV
ncbi:VG15 protein [Mycobacteroides abscessus]|uniref:VG15 protein n=1 Tax=Mycobacteroides abscessus TaxID=36809 RepID=UPI00092C4D49|nr:ADP-ribosyltransferase [Mycobacteroides abscessus]DAZ90240.1 TPA_asm: Minor capsid and ADP-ribosyltransferase domain fusion protein [Mycobacterium phage prophiFSIL01-1]SHZ92364.1 ADP-ribosyltransferase exoenzyme [Mycobacteroides abscessus subsp. abscessus]SIA07532.1 ADP-ribosyltransferase exoenzyme [Mycobacteroides abscessus subsp. abscessus]SIA65378.1 ADP-ribosyltransferase exoenzyme [Mycobacteroides abscessus subsp. abscessus]SIA70509.1 ADP-ribosyltransferase exoenzyme [Mycobacteroides ab